MFKRLGQYCIFIVFISPFGAFAVGQSARAQAPLYKVELIVFAHITAQGLLSEQWPASPALPAMNRVYDLKSILQQTATLDDPAVTPTVAKMKPYQILPSTYFDLSQAAAKLTAKDDYPLLVHVAWLQPGLPIRNARRIHIFGGQPYTLNGQPLTDISPLNVDKGDLALPEPSNSKQWQLNGYVRVSKPYLFQLHANLVLTIPASLLQQVSPSAASQLQTNQFVLQQIFRMRLGQLYYIDHPLFGILAKITKYSVSNKTSL